MRPHFILFGTFAVLFLAVSCKKKQEEVKPEIKIPTESQAIFSGGISFDSGSESSGSEPSGEQPSGKEQSTTVKFTATESWRASVAETKASSWLRVQPSSGGAGTVNMTVTAQPNTTDQARSVTVTIQCGTVTLSFTVIQAAAAPQVVNVESIKLSAHELVLAPGASETLTATVLPQNATDKTVTWSTSQSEIATVDNGKVTAVKEGRTFILAQAGEKQDTCWVTVEAKVVAVESVKLNKAELTLEPGASETLTATVLPENATDKTVTWSTSLAEIATVDEGKVTAVKEGMTFILAQAGEKQDTCWVTVEAKVVEVESVKLNKSELTLEPGASETLTATVLPENATDKTVTWSTSQAEIATVDKGKVSAVKEGRTFILAQAGVKQDTCWVTVKAKVVEVESVKLNKAELTLEPGASETLTATVLPENATDKTVTWSTSQTEIATVDNGKVTAVKEGKAFILAQAGEKQDTCWVTVNAKVVEVESVSLNKMELSLEPGTSETLIATVLPENATNKTVTWATSNAEVATVADGKVSALKEGEAVISAKAGGKDASCKVTVKKGVVAVTSITLNKEELTLVKGEEETLTATVNPENATDKTVTWTSSDTGIATVDKNGKVSALKGGEAIIMAKAGEQSASCKLTVKVPVQSVSLDQSSVSLEEGKEVTLVATVNPEDATDVTVTWSSSDNSVASVDKGVVKALKAGEAIITVKAGENEATCKVTVTYQFSITPTEVTIACDGQSFTVTVVCTGTYEVESKPEWMSQESVANKVHTFKAESNSAASQRSGTIVFLDGKGTRLSCSVTQMGQSSNNVGGGNEKVGEEEEINW